MATKYGNRPSGKAGRSYVTYTKSQTATNIVVTIKAGYYVAKSSWNTVSAVTCSVTGTGQKKLTGSLSKATRKGVKHYQMVSGKYTFARKASAYTVTIANKVTFSNYSTSLSFKITIPAQNSVPVSVEIERADASGELNEEGFYAKAVLDVDATGHTTTIAPTVTVDGVAKSVTWLDENGNTAVLSGVKTAKQYHCLINIGAPFYSHKVVVKTKVTSGSAIWNYTDDETFDISVIPKWKVKHRVESIIPDLFSNGKADVEVIVKNYTTGEFDTMTSNYGFPIDIIGQYIFDIEVMLDEHHVAQTEIDEVVADTTTTEIKVAYRKANSTQKPQREAFYKTTKCMNFHNGLANNMFVGGCDVADYNSRVWYSALNNPLYFPDTNYIEAGSNDKKVMGLTKVGDYLGIIKQGSTTDTSIYLAYATTFDDNTTYALRSQVNGIGAFGKYGFNVVGDETLFLSKDGIMAIDISEDETKQVRNRSFYINKKLCSEENLENAFSIEWKGFYALAINDRLYLLDSSQKTSWENEKTNLQYEAYYFENFPALTMAKYKENLWFNTKETLCRMKSYEKDGINAYNDDGEPIFAEWSTILDDDKSVNFFKNLQKKGNIVSILPFPQTSATVWVKKDNEDEEYIGEINANEPPFPVDLYMNKKVKKYKRLQFIIRNAVKNEGFGVNQIIKNYTLGNYSKNRRNTDDIQSL